MINTATLKENKKLTEDVYELTFQTKQPLNFIGGQFVTIKIADQEKPCFRAYSIASPPSDNEFKLCIKVMDGGRGSNWLKELKIGEDVVFLGPSGKFIFEPSNKKVIFVATGTGLAPFTSIIQEELAKGNNQNLHLIFGVRHINDVFYKDLLDELQQKYKNFTYKITLSQPENESWNGEKGRVTDILEKTSIDPTNTSVYICGLKNMIDSVTELLTSKGVPEENVHFEKFD